MIQLIATDIFLAMIAAVVFPCPRGDEQQLREAHARPLAAAQELIGEVSSVAHESIDGALVVKTLGREAAETERLAIKAERCGTSGRGGVPPRHVRGGPDALPALVAAILLLVGSWRVGRGRHHAGSPLGFIAPSTPRLADGFIG